MDGITLPDESTRRRVELLLFGSLSTDDQTRWTPCRGGLSDARVWRVERSGSAFAVRRCATGRRDEYAIWVRQCQGAAFDAGLTFVAVPLGTGWPILESPHRYDAAAWRLGLPVSELKQDDQAVAAASGGLAQLHQYLSTMTPSTREAVNVFRVARGDLAGACPTSWRPFERSTLERWPELIKLTQRLPPAIVDAIDLLDSLPDRPSTAQSIHGDARPEHFLVEDGQLTGLIDFDAMRTDDPLADVARFAGEIAAGDAVRRDQVVTFYEEAITQPVDRQAVAALDLATAAIAASNWFRWIRDSQLVERRDPGLIRGRLARLLARLTPR